MDEVLFMGHRKPENGNEGDTQNCHVHKVPVHDGAVSLYSWHKTVISPFNSQENRKAGREKTGNRRAENGKTGSW
jgi:hypothetical protein